MSTYSRSLLVTLATGLTLEARLQDPNGAIAPDALPEPVVEVDTGIYLCAPSLDAAFIGLVLFRQVSNSAIVARFPVEPPAQAVTAYQTTSGDWFGDWFGGVTTPVESCCSGDGSVLVNHDYGGIDNLRVLNDDLVPIDNAQIMAFLFVDYEAGHRGPAYRKGSTSTNVDGRWVAPLSLDPELYTLVVTHPDQYEPDVMTLSVTAPA